MSSPATATFLTHWRNHATRAPVALALIEIDTPSAVTLRVATREVTTPDGNTWEAGLKCDPIRWRIDQLDTGPNPCDTTIYLANRLYPFMTSGVVCDTVPDYRWQGATVTLYRWNDVRNGSGAQLLAWADVLPMGVYRVDGLQSGDQWLKLSLLQDQSWNNRVPTTVVDRISYPNAPDVSQGRPIPIVYGNHVALPLRSPHTAAYTNKQYQEDSGAGQGAVPMILVDPGLGAANVKLVASSHACGDLLSRSTGYTQFMVANDVLAPLDTTGITEALGAGESYITINDDTLIAYYGVRPVDVRAGGVNTADNARRAADPFDETSYASINQAAGKGVLELSLPSVSSLGQIESVRVICCFSGAAGNANTFHVRPQVPGGASGTAVVSTLGQAQSATPVILVGAWDAAFVGAQTWQFGGTATGTPWDVKCEFTGGAANTARVYWVALSVKFRPQRSLVTPAYVSGGFFAGISISPYTQYARDWELSFLASAGSRLNPALLQVEGQFFGNIKGYADDGFGTYTGIAAAVIARPCDIVRHFLATYGNVAAGSIETGAAAFGSFVAARDTLKNASPTDYALACWIGHKSSVQQVIKDICGQSLMAVYLDRFTNKWLAHVWRRAPAVDYDLAFERTDFPDLFECGVTSDVTLVQGVRVRWKMDYFKGRTMFETFVNSDSSSQGYALPTVRDQILTVVAGVNDDLDWIWSTGPTTYADVITAGTYVPIDLAAEVRTQMRTHQPTIHTGWGFSIKTGINDKLDYLIGATPYVATLDEGDYTADSLCIEAAKQMTAGAHGLTFTFVYAQATNKFTATVSSGNFTADVVGAPNSATSGWFALGWDRDTVSVGSTTTGQSARYKDCFWFTPPAFGGSPTFDLMFGTGTSAATNCANVLGFDKADQVAGSAQYSDYARNQRETLCAASEDAFGPRADTEIVAGWVHDEATAQRLRDGLFDFGSTPLVWLKLRSHACPDMQRMRVFACSADMDLRRPYPGYGSDGSWANKRMRALEGESDMGPSFHDEVFALEA